MNMKAGEEAKFSHIAIVVKDIEKTLEEYCKVFHLEKPAVKWTGSKEEANVMYRGASTPARAKQAFLQLDTLCVELMEPDENDSTWREYLDKKGEGFHHIGVEIQHMDEILETLRKNQIPAVQTGQYRTGQYAYVESEGKLNLMLELLENH